MNYSNDDLSGNDKNLVDFCEQKKTDHTNYTTTNWLWFTAICIMVGLFMISEAHGCTKLTW